MNQDRHAVLWQNNVRTTWKITTMKPETKTDPVQRASHRQFGFGVARFDTRHVPTATLLG